MLKADFIRRVRTCERRLYRVARTLISRECDCEDVVQEALLRAWDKLHTLKHESCFEMWLLRIVINQCKSFYRRRSFVFTELTEDIPQPEPEETQLLEVLMNLPPKPRLVLELHYIEGYRVKEVAGILNMPEGTVKWQLSRGRELLKQALNEMEVHL